MDQRWKSKFNHELFKTGDWNAENDVTLLRPVKIGFLNTDRQDSINFRSVVIETLWNTSHQTSQLGPATAKA